MFSVGYVSWRFSTAVLLKIQVFWDVTLCPWVSTSGVLKAFIFGLKFYILLDCFTLKVQILRSLDVVNYLPNGSVTSRNVNISDTTVYELLDSGVGVRVTLLKPVVGS